MAVRNLRPEMPDLRAGRSRKANWKGKGGFSRRVTRRSAVTGLGYRAEDKLLAKASTVLQSVKILFSCEDFPRIALLP
jgi:hypothetical protein